MTSRLINQRFELLERVGEGAFFQVFKARDKVSGRVVALRMVQSAFALDAAFLAALRKETAAVTGLTHPNIARLEEVGEEDGYPFLVTEFVRGINLKERIRRIAPFTLSVAVNFAIAIGEALQYAHAQGQMHGDLRPHNVIVSPEGAVKVTDFGMTRVLAASGEAAASNLGRAIHYQAPEVATGCAPTVASDIYAVGVILFEMLTGGVPYPGDTPLNIVQKHQNDPVPSPRTLNPGVPRSLEGIVMKTLLKRPEDRYRSSGDLLNDLKSVRDALRFGKPLSWSPLEESAAAAAAAPVGAASKPPEEMGRRGEEERRRKTEAATASERGGAPVPGAARMSATTAHDDRVSPYLKIAIAAVIVILLIVGIAGAATFMAMLSTPPEKKFPNLVGMKIAEARRTAEQVSARLMEHEEFNERVDSGVVYKVDPQLEGRNVRPGRSINVWVSRGSRMVWVPNVVKLSKEEAEAKIKEAGLTLGAVNRAYSDKVPFDHVIGQNPSARKRVNRDVAVNLTMSDGPKITESPPDEGFVESDPNRGQSETGNGVESSTGIGEQPPSTGDQTVHFQNLKLTIKADGRGVRRVRIEYDDAAGTHRAVDEYHDEGETVLAKVSVTGPKVTVRVYYGDSRRPVSERTYRVDENR